MGDDKLFNKLQNIYLEHGFFDTEKLIDMKLVEIGKKIQKVIRKVERVHLSHTPFILTKNSIKQPVFSEKPEGLWYAFGDSWIKDVVLGVPEWLTTYAYELVVDTNKLKNISKFGMDIFIEEYGDEDYRGKYKWDLMSRKFCGAETKDRIVVDKLLHSWAAISGCIWNPVCIIHLKEIDLGLTNEEKDFIKHHANQRV